MTVLNQQQTNDLFCDIESRLLGASSVILEYLNNLKPACSELGQIEWRYRLSGFLEGLSLTGHIDSLYLESLASMLFARDVKSCEVRPGRAMRSASTSLLTNPRFTALMFLQLIHWMLTRSSRREQPITQYLV